MNLIDASVVGLYLLVLFTIGLVSARKSKDQSAESFFLTNKTLPWFAIGFTIIASGISSEHFLGAVGYSYTFGLAVANWEWLNAPSLIILIVFFIPIYLRKNVVTMPQFLEMRFNHSVRLLFAIITILIYTFINLAGVIYSGGIALQGILDLDTIYLGVITVTLIGGFFAIYGGMESVAWTNVFQAVLLLGGGLIVFIMGINTVPGGLSEILGDGNRAKLILPSDDPEIPWTGLMVLTFSTNIWFFCTNQSINQAALGAKNEWNAKMGILFAGFLMIIIPLADVFPGLIAYALGLNPKDSAGGANSAYLDLVEHLLPVGLRGVVYAALCGAIISTIEAMSNACSTIFTFDIYPVISKLRDDKQLIKTGRITGILVLIVAALWTPVVGTFQHIFQYFQQCWAFIAIPAVIVFFLGILWKNFSDRAAVITLLLSFPMFLMPYLLNFFSIGLNAYVAAGYTLIIVLVFSVLISILLPNKDKKEVSGLIWASSLLKENDRSHPWYKTISFWAVLLLVIYIGIYVYIEFLR